MEYSLLICPICLISFGDRNCCHKIVNKVKCDGTASLPTGIKSFSYVESFSRLNLKIPNSEESLSIEDSKDSSIDEGSCCDDKICYCPKNVIDEPKILPFFHVKGMQNVFSCVPSECHPKGDGDYDHWHCGYCHGLTKFQKK